MGAAPVCAQERGDGISGGGPEKAGASREQVSRAQRGMRFKNGNDPLPTAQALLVRIQMCGGKVNRNVTARRALRSFLHNVLSVRRYFLYR